MKKFHILTMLITIILGCMIFTSKVNATTTYNIGELTTSNVNVRSKNTTKSTSVGKLSKGQKVFILSSSFKNNYNWYKIYYNGKKRYVCADYVKIIKDNVSLKQSTIIEWYIEKYGNVTAKIVNLRKSPSTNSKVVYKVKNTNNLKITGKTYNNWYKVIVNKKTGYIRSDLVKFTDDSSAYPILATYTTYYDNSNINRSINIEVASKTINGKVIKKNSSFNFLNIVGQTTPEKGYKKANVISNGKYVLDYGGGVCQVSSTIYNVALKAKLKITKVYHHSKNVGYVPKGKDATISYSSGKNLIFKNNKKYDIIIFVTANNGTLTVKICKYI